MWIARILLCCLPIWTAAPAEILSRYRKLIATLHTLAQDAAKLAESASESAPEDGALLQ